MHAYYHTRQRTFYLRIDLDSFQGCVIFWRKTGLLLLKGEAFVFASKTTFNYSCVCHLHSMRSIYIWSFQPIAVTVSEIWKCTDRRTDAHTYKLKQSYAKFTCSLLIIATANLVLTFLIPNKAIICNLESKQFPFLSFYVHIYCIRYSNMITV